MGVAANLDENSGVGQCGQIGRHDRHAPAKKTERANRHAAHLDRNQFLNALAIDLQNDFDWIVLTPAGVPVGLVRAFELVAQLLPELQSFLHDCDQARSLANSCSRSFRARLRMHREKASAEGCGADRAPPRPVARRQRKAMRNRRIATASASSPITSVFLTKAGDCDSRKSRSCRSE